MFKPKSIASTGQGERKPFQSWFSRKNVNQTKPVTSCNKTIYQSHSESLGKNQCLGLTWFNLHLSFPQLEFFRIYTTANSLYLKVSQPGPRIGIFRWPLRSRNPTESQSAGGLRKPQQKSLSYGRVVVVKIGPPREAMGGEVRYQFDQQKTSQWRPKEPECL